MKAYYLTQAQRVEARDADAPQPAAGQVLIAIRRVGICGSDIEYFRHFKCGAFIAKRPFVLGHEFAGVVAGAGSGVTAVKEGDRIGVDPAMPCGECDFCRTGRYNLCRNMRFMGSASVDPHMDGGMREFVVMPERNCLPLPDSLSWEEAAALEPLTIALHACARAGSVVGKSALILGGGTIGQLVLLTLRAFGVGTVTVGDPVAERRAQALALGATHAFDPTSQDVPGEMELVFEASGAPAAVTAAVHAARRGGTVVYIGTITRDVAMPVNLIMVKELNVLGSFRTAHQFPVALNLMSDRRIDVRPIITHRFPIADVNQAFAVTALPEAVKVQLTVGE
ncbi:MAG: hypothetical protein EA403_17215 [Spirochaetaceae bacterium]|nr:MAG: hypothetical protein EA403_17215 [Spirochaetaceae bacterium]